MSEENQANSMYFDLREEMLLAVGQAIKETDVVADIGCGIMPMAHFRPRLHLMVEPYQEYVDVLSYRYQADKSVIILRSGALPMLNTLADNSVDSIFLIDVIEHIEKDDGQKIIVQAERVAREQVVVFTPLGFMPQHLELGEADGWGLSGGSFQEHRSGWLPEDFGSEWTFYICRQFHTQDHHGKTLETPYGAFYAIRNFEHKEVLRPKALSDFRPVLPVEKEFRQLQAELGCLREEHSNLKNTCSHLEQSISALNVEYQGQCQQSIQQAQTIAQLERQLAERRRPGWLKRLW